MWSPDDAEPAFFAAAVGEDYRPNPNIPRNLVHFLDRGSLLALDAALQAIDSAGLGAGAGDSRRFAVVDGLPYRAPGQPAIFVPYGHLVARALGIRGSAVSLAGAEASGALAIAAAARMVAQGDADVVVAGAGQGLQRALLEHLPSQGAATPPSPLDAAHAGSSPRRVPPTSSSNPRPRARARRLHCRPHRRHRLDPSTLSSNRSPLATQPRWAAPCRRP